ncbi:MAG: glycosyltransferase family 2 protein [Ignavibacteria bacterium]
MITVIIPNYNGIEHLDECLNSLKNQTFENFQIVIIDNGSSDSSVTFIENNYPEVKLIKLNSNTGFSVAVNKGVKYALEEFKSQYILLLNNDIQCSNSFIEEMMKGFVSEEVGSVASKMLNYYHRTIIDNAGDFIKKMGSPFARGHGEVDKGQYDKPEFVFGACAGAAMYKAAVFKDIGFFDEDFFAYYEDVDFSFRLQLCGYKCFYNPKAICYHKRGATTSHYPGYQIELCEKNLIALRVKNYPLRLLILWKLFFSIARIKRYADFLFSDKPSLFLSAIKGYFRGNLELYQSFRKRCAVQKKVKVSYDYIKSLFL